MFYSISPHLICLEKETHNLIFSHFANVSVYNSLDPDMTLDILKQLRSPQTINQLKKALKHSSLKIQSEVDRLVSQNFVFPVKNNIKDTSPKSQDFFGYFVKDPIALRALDKILQEIKVGILDLTEDPEALISSMKNIGYKNIQKISLKNFSQSDLIVVVAQESHRFTLSKISQKLRKEKKKWLLVMLDPFGGIIGPTFGIAGGPCFDCILDNSKRNFTKTTDLNYQNLADKSAPPKNSFIAKSLFPFVAIESAKVAAGFVRPFSFDGFMSFDLFNFRMDYSPAPPSPTCPVCAEIAN